MKVPPLHIKRFQVRRNPDYGLLSTPSHLPSEAEGKPNQTKPSNTNRTTNGRVEQWSVGMWWQTETLAHTSPPTLLTSLRTLKKKERKKKKKKKKKKIKKIKKLQASCRCYGNQPSLGK